MIFLLEMETLFYGKEDLERKVEEGNCHGGRVAVDFGRRNHHFPQYFV